MGNVIKKNQFTLWFNLFKKAHAYWPNQTQLLWKNLTNNPLSIPVSAAFGGFTLGHSAWHDMEIYFRGVAASDLRYLLPLFESMMDFSGIDILKKINRPGLVVAGDRDAVTPLDHQHKIHENYPGSELLIVPRGSHCAQLDAPEFVNLRIEKFLRDHNYT